MVLEIAAALVAALSLGASTFVTPTGASNALTLPAQRHLLRMTPDGGAPIWLLAIQKSGRDSDGLVFMRSDDDGEHWAHMADIQPAFGHPDRADLLALGPDVALVYSWEEANLSGSTTHDVYFQWWRFRPATRDWAPQPRVLVFDSTSASSGYLRAELARDSLGRFWVMATRYEGGAFSLVTAVSADGGASFQPDTTLATTGTNRAGGRLLSLGTRLIALYDVHDANTAARYRLRADTSPIGQWEAERVAFTEGIYHGAALSAVAAPGGGMHLVYKSESEQLRYRYFDGASFGPATNVDTQGDWAVQPAVTLRGAELIVFFTHVLAVNRDYELRVRVLADGAFGPPEVLDDLAEFKGYPAAAERLPTSVTEVPCLYSQALDDATSSGWAKIAFASRPPPEDAGVPGPDAGPSDSGLPDAGTVDAGVPDAGSADAGTTDAGSDGGAERLLFSDDFSRNLSSGLGNGWAIDRGAWRIDGAARSTASTDSLAHPSAVSCADCRLEATLTPGGADAGLLLRAQLPSGGTGYLLAALANGTVQLRRWRNWSFVVLAQATRAASDLTAPVRLSLRAKGAGPVELEALVDGRRLLAYNDTTGAIVGGGTAGLWANRAGAAFDGLRLWETVAAPPPDPDPDPDTVGLPFSDNFSRTVSSGLGAGWTIVSGSWTVRDAAITQSSIESAAYPTTPLCADCEVEARVNAGSNYAGIFLRARPTAPSYRYELIFHPTGPLELRRRSGGAVVSLGLVSSGVAAGSSLVMALQAVGSNPVVLTVRVNGSVRMTVSDGASGAHTATGKAGIGALGSGVSFDDFRIGAPR